MESYLLVYICIQNLWSYSFGASFVVLMGPIHIAPCVVCYLDINPFARTIEA